MKKIRKKVLSMILSFVMVIWLIPSNIYANPESSTDLWTDYAADSFAGGKGTEEDPYQIATAEQLAKLANDVNENYKNSGKDGYHGYEGKFFKITENIDLGKYNWEPIGNELGRSFKGFLNGNNCSITNMKIDNMNSINNDTNKSICGLFGVIKNVNSTITGVKNLNIDNAEIHAYPGKNSFDEECLYSGILVGYTDRSDNDNIIEFENINVSGKIINHPITGEGSCSGGMIGYSGYNSFKNCTANVSIEGTSNTGGFVGCMFDNSTIENCKVSGSVEGLWSLGGFVGYINGKDSIVKKCISEVDVNGCDWRLGGFVGYNQNGEIESCISKGDVESTVTEWEPKVGGFVGEQESGSIISSHSIGKVISSHDTIKAGGFSGEGPDGITDSSFNKDVNPSLKGVGGTAQEDVTGIEVGTELEVNSNICEDYYGTHDITKVEAKEPTTTTDGNIEYYKCERCKKCFKDSQATEPIDEKDTIIEATGSSGGSGGGTITPSKPEPTKEEIIGKDRYETAALVADKVGNYETVILVNADETMSDGLSASSLSGKYNAPILLVKQNKIPDVSMKRIQKAKKVYIIGGTNAISKEVEKQLSGKNITRIDGANRYETSELISKELGNYSKVFIVNGKNGEADAMSASSISAKYIAPIILTNGKSSNYIKEENKEYYVIGGKNVVSDSIVEKYSARRIAGEDRYETNRKVISEFYSGSNKYYVANGNTLVDALTASILTQEKGVVLVNEKSDNSILEDKSTVQIGGFDFEI